MGMFDTILVEKSLIDSLLEKEWIPFMHCDFHSLYYDFQTKDLQNCLFNYFIEKNGEFLCQKNGYISDEEIEAAKKESPGVTSYVSFYDFIQTDTEQIELTFEAHIIKDVLQSIAIKDFKKYNLKELRENHEKQRKIWDKIESYPEMKIFRFLQNCEFFLEKWSRPLIKKYTSLKYGLKDIAEKKARLV